MNEIAMSPQSLFDLLMLDDEALAELVAQRRRDETTRFAFCRRLGAVFRATRLAHELPIDEVARSSGTSPRLLRLIEAGALDETWIPDETIEGVAESLDLDPDALYQLAGGVDEARWAALVARFREWVAGRVEILAPEPLPTRSPIGEPARVERKFGAGVWLGPVEGQESAVVLEVHESGIGNLANAPLLVVIQHADGTILAEHVFEHVTGVVRAELAADARAATGDDVVVVLAQKPEKS